MPGSGIRDVPRQKETGLFRVKLKPQIFGCVDLTEICLAADWCSLARRVVLAIFFCTGACNHFQVFRVAEWCKHKLAKLNR